MKCGKFEALFWKLPPVADYPRLHCCSFETLWQVANPKTWLLRINTLSTSCDRIDRISMLRQYCRSRSESTEPIWGFLLVVVVVTGQIDQIPWRMMMSTAEKDSQWRTLINSPLQLLLLLLPSTSSSSSTGLSPDECRLLASFVDGDDSSGARPPLLYSVTFYSERTYSLRGGGGRLYVEYHHPVAACSSSRTIISSSGRGNAKAASEFSSNRSQRRDGT